MKIFHETNEFHMYSAINYIDMEEIETIDDSIKKSPFTVLFTHHSIKDPKTYEMTLDEYRASF